MLLSTLRRYVEAMGGKLELVAKFPDRPPLVIDHLAEETVRAARHEHTGQGARLKADRPRAVRGQPARSPTRIPTQSGFLLPDRRASAIGCNALFHEAFRLIARGWTPRRSASFPGWAASSASVMCDPLRMKAQGAACAAPR
ncbi:MAG: hypothetical protein MZW92_64490 [Comamonadaceae bacterium]|nr:hypothetical protein [Comamonadaceae bacterium]